MSRRPGKPIRITVDELRRRMSSLSASAKDAAKRGDLPASVRFCRAHDDLAIILIRRGIRPESGGLVITIGGAA